MSDEDPRREDHIIAVQPPHFPKPKGYANGVLARGRTLYIAGQVGWDTEERIVGEDLAAQFIQALDNVIDVVAAAGGRPTDIVKMTAFVTDVDEYVQARRALRGPWTARFGQHYPAMALIGISRLFEAGAKVEIEAIAVLPD